MNFKDKNILVTGGAGFVGSKISEKLIELGANVTILDNLKTGRMELIPEKAMFYFGSVDNYKIVKTLCFKKDYVFHLASNVLLDESISADIDTNIIGTLNLLDCINKETRLVYTSTSSVYGNNKKLDLIGESAPIDLLSSYSISKFSAENYIKLKSKNYNIVRYSNIYGPNQSPYNPKCGVISKFLTSETINITGDGSDVRDFTYIDDAVILTLALATTPHANTIYNCSTGIGTNLLDLAKMCAKITNKPIQTIGKRSIDNINKRVVDNFKARTILGWEPKTNLHDGLNKTHEYVKNCCSDTLRP